MGGSGGGGGEVVVLGRLGVAERVMGVEEPEPPEVNLCGRGMRRTSSSKSSELVGMKAGAAGFFPDIMEVRGKRDPKVAIKEA